MSAAQKLPTERTTAEYKVPDSPWCDIAIDLFKCHGDTYVLVVDAYSWFIEIKKMNTSMAVIRVLSEMFASHGVCNTLFSDNGPQFSSD